LEHKIVEREEFLVVGMPVKISLRDPGYKQKLMDLWNEFMPRVQEIKNRKNELFYGLCNISEGIEGDECSFEHMSCIEVESADEVPEGMKSQKVPAAKYFVVTHKGSLDKLGETYGAIEQEMKKLGLEEDRSKMFFELYDHRFKKDSDDSELDIYSALKD
jgi:AraC family transcriptional regulator